MQLGSIPGGTTKLRSKIMKVDEFQTFSDFLFYLRQRKICNFRHICRTKFVAFFLRPLKKATELHLIHRYSSICAA